MAPLAYSTALTVSSLFFLIIRDLMFRRYGVTAESAAEEDLARLPTPLLKTLYKLSALVFTAWFLF